MFSYNTIVTTIVSNKTPIMCSHSVSYKISRGQTELNMLRTFDLMLTSFTLTYPPFDFVAWFMFREANVCVSMFDSLGWCYIGCSKKLIREEYSFTCVACNETNALAELRWVIFISVFLRIVRKTKNNFPFDR